MLMENSRHERAMTVVASYVIGFTSAYIAFGATQTPLATPIITETPPAVATKAEVKHATLRVEEAGLVVVTEDRERLLSARKSSALAANALGAVTNQPGFAERLVEAELSRDGSFVYFCEVLDYSSDTCDAYVYDVALDTVYPVQLGAEVYRPSADLHRSIWTEAGYLVVDQYRSISTEKPWLLQ